MLDSLTKGIQLPDQIIQTLKFSENTHKIFELTIFGLGFIGLHGMLNDFCVKNRDISKSYENFTRSEQIVFRYANLFGNISLILDAAKSEPAISAWKWSVRQLLSNHEFEGLFIHRGFFPTENLRRTTAIVSFLCRLPSTLTTLYCIYQWYTSTPSKPVDNPSKNAAYKSIIQPKHIYMTATAVSETAKTLLKTPQK